MLRPVSEFAGNTSVMTLVSEDNLSSEIKKKNIFREEVYRYSHQLEDSTETIKQGWSCFQIYNDQNNFTKDLDNWLQADPLMLSQLCCPLEVAHKEGEMTSFLLLVGVYTYWKVGPPRPLQCV